MPCVWGYVIASHRRPHPAALATPRPPPLPRPCASPPREAAASDTPCRQARRRTGALAAGTVAASAHGGAPAAGAAPRVGAPSRRKHPSPAWPPPRGVRCARPRAPRRRRRSVR
eukprot:5461659-Prymnesium_polylepis.1